MVHASTLGALEALLQFLREECKPPIPVSHVNIGPIHKKDVMRANIMNEKKMPEYATILAFDTTIDAEAREMAEESNVRIFSADIIYHLFDQFTAYMNGLREVRKTEAQNVVVFPCVLKILPQHIFNKKDPIVMGVEVVEGTLRLGTMLCVPNIGLDIGKVTRIENNHKEVTFAKKSTQVSISFEFVFGVCTLIFAKLCEVMCIAHFLRVGVHVCRIYSIFVGVFAMCVYFGVAIFAGVHPHL